MFCFLYFAFCILLLVFCFLYSVSYILLLVFYFLCSASCILLLVAHTHAAVTLICVFCSVSLVVTVLSVAMRSRHLSLDVACTYILLLVFFCLSLIFML